MPVRGLREIAYKTKKVAFDNDFMNSQWIKYMPHGHVTLENVLFAPLNIDDLTVGVIGIANKPGGFTEIDAEHLRKDGFILPVEISTGAVNFHGQKCILSATQDITKRKQAENALRASEKKFRSIFDNSSDAIFIHDLNGRFLEVNEVACQRLGYSRNELLQKGPIDINSVESGKLFTGRIQSLDHEGHQVTERGCGQIDVASLDHGGHQVIEAVHMSKSGAEIPVEINSRKIDYNGKPCVLSVARDITERKTSEEKLVRQNYYLEKAQELGKIGTWELDIINNIMVWTDENCRIFEVPEGSVVDYETFIERVHPDDRDFVNQEWHAAVRGKPYDIEHRLLLDGNVKWVREKADVEFNEEGIGVKAIGFTQDITDRKLAEEALKESKAFLENMNDIAYMADDHGNVHWVNPAIERVTGLPPEEIIGKPFIPLFAETDHASLIDVYKRSLAGESLENTLTFESGVSCHFTSLPRRNFQGDIIGTFGIARDISERLAAERSLRTSEARLKKAQSIAKVGNWEYDIATGKVWGSEEAFRIYDIDQTSGFLSLDELESRIVDAKRVNQALMDLISQKKVYDIEFQIKTKNRKELTYIHSKADLVCDREGKPVKVIGVIQDITDYQRVESQRKRSEETYRNLLNNLSAGVVVHAPDTSVVIANRSACRILGLTKDQLFGKKAVDPRWKFLRDDGSEMPLEKYPVNRVLSTQKELHNQVVGVTRPETGDIAWALANGFPVFNRDRKIEQVIVNFIEITDMKMAQQAVLDTNEKMRLAAESAHFGIWELDVSKNRIEWDDWMFRLYGLSRDSYDDAFEAWKAALHPDDRERCSMEVEQVLRDKKDFNTEFRIVRPDGQVRNIKAHATVSLDSSGEPVKMTGLNYDITEHKQMEAQIIESQKMESIGNLAGGIAHDFNNILFPIIGLSEMFLEDLPPGSLEHENAEEIYKAAKRGSDLVKQILAFSRQSKHEITPVRIQMVLKEVLKLVRATIPSNIEIHSEIQQNCSLVMADPTQVHQIAMNLITNAFHAVEQTGGNIKVTLAEAELKKNDATEMSLKPGNYALISVSDSGNGIPPENIKKIFEPYFTTKEQGKGTGLGLAVVFGIVKEHDGDIQVRSEVGRGTTFDVYFPLMEKSTGLINPEGTEGIETGSESILLVDDEPAVVRLETQILKRLGYKVTARTSSSDALETFRASPDSFDLVLSDMAMPHMTGIELSREITKIRPGIPVIVCTGFSERLNEEKAKSFGIMGLLMKPVTRHKMARMIRKALD